MAATRMDEDTAWLELATVVLVVVSSSCQCGSALDSGRKQPLATHVFSSKSRASSDLHVEI